jgi:hypothetical protein
VPNTLCGKRARPVQKRLRNTQSIRQHVQSDLRRVLVIEWLRQINHWMSSDEFLM